jgi:biotin-(acetyl-CoA carboxylase) ligase
MADSMPRALSVRLGESAILQRPLDLPPGFSEKSLRESGDAFAHACAIASQEGAGTLVWVRRYDLVEFAVVLEPQEPLALARLVFYPCMNAVADALALHCPPERPISFDWPDALRFDGGLLGGGRLGWPDDAPDHLPPDWLVFGAQLRSSLVVAPDPGLRPDAVALDELGFEEVEAIDLIESFARHLLTGMHDWSERGAKLLAKRWLDRLARVKGVSHGIDANGDLLMRTDQGTRRRIFVDALASPSWLDPETREPRL